MNKEKITIFIFSVILISLIVAKSIRESLMEKKAHCTIIIHSPESENNETTAPLNVSTSTSASKTKENKAPEIVRTTVSASIPAIESVTAEPEILYININTAGAEELMQLPGVGQVLAERIIEYRETYGYFRNIEEIVLVSGISDGIFSKICQNIYVENPIYNEDEYVISESDEHENLPDNSYEEEPDPIAEEVTDAPKPTLYDVMPIDLNTADIKTLTLLPYINEDTAQKIIDLRNDIGGFSHPYEIYYIEDLEQYQVDEISEYVTVSP